MSDDTFIRMDEKLLKEFKEFIRNKEEGK